MIKTSRFAAVLAIGALAATPALAQGSGTNLSTGSNTATNPGQQSANQGPARASNQTYGQNRIDQLQTRLQDLGFYHGNIDGRWGPETRRALADFQGQHGLQQTGELNVATASQLGLLNNRPSQPANNANPNANNANHGQSAE